jgi:hypothetical protein
MIAGCRGVGRDAAFQRFEMGESVANLRQCAAQASARGMRPGVAHFRQQNCSYQLAGQPSGVGSNKFQSGSMVST